jgi:hypothetical protein
VADTNALVLTLGSLAEQHAIETGDAVRCEKCDAALSAVSEVSAEQGGGKRRWTCEFCSHLNMVDIDDDELPASGALSQQFLLEPPASNACRQRAGSRLLSCRRQRQHVGVATVAARIRPVSAAGGGGGGQQSARDAERKQLQEALGLSDAEMAQQMHSAASAEPHVTRLECVQAAISIALAEMARAKPRTQVVLVTFADDVRVYASANEPPMVIAGDKLNSVEQLRAACSKLSLSAVPQVASDQEALVERVMQLTEGGATALGPALVVATAIAALKKNATVTLCTDGLANVGVGALDGASAAEMRAASAFYRDIAAFAKSASTSVSVVAIEGGGRCALNELKALSGATGGTMTVAKPFEVQRRFREVIDNPVLASDVRVCAHISAGFAFVDPTAAAAEPAPHDPARRRQRHCAERSRLALRRDDRRRGGARRHNPGGGRVQPARPLAPAARLHAALERRRRREEGRGGSIRRLGGRHGGAAARRRARRGGRVGARARRAAQRQRLCERASVSNEAKEELDALTSDFAREFDGALRRLEASKTRVADVDDDSVALFTKMRTVPRTALLAGSRKRELVAQRKKHIGELKQLLV